MYVTRPVEHPKEYTWMKEQMLAIHHYRDEGSHSQLVRIKGFSVYPPFEDKPGHVMIDYVVLQAGDYEGKWGSSFPENFEPYKGSCPHCHGTGLKLD